MRDVLRRLSRYGSGDGHPLLALDALVEGLAVVAAERAMARFERQRRDVEALPSRGGTPYPSRLGVAVDATGLRGGHIGVRVRRPSVRRGRTARRASRAGHSIADGQRAGGRAVAEAGR